MSELDKAFAHWINHEYTEGMTTREALRSAFVTGVTSGAQAQKNRDLVVVELEQLEHDTENCNYRPNCDDCTYQSAIMDALHAIRGDQVNE